MCLMQYLARQGFSYDDIKKVLSDDENQQTAYRDNDP